MYFNRFDVCEAYYVFACLYHSGQNSEQYRILNRLNRIGFRAKFTLNEAAKPRLGLSENGYEIYKGLVRKNRGLVEWRATGAL